MRRRGGRVVVALIVAGVAMAGVAPAVVHAQEDTPAAPRESAAGRPVPDSDRMRFDARFMAGYGNDRAQFGLGFENQGRIGYAILDVFGRINDRVTYRFSFNPVNELDPRPACGEEGYFYPNDPAFLGDLGPNVVCESDGNRRVDMYKSIGLDPLNQQGPVREAWVDVDLGRSFTARFGRFILPIGFGWEEAGSYTTKDATRIQRINAEANFGLMFSWQSEEDTPRPRFSADLAGFLGDGNRNRDYDYFYFERSDLDSNSALTMLFGGAFLPTPAIDIRVAGKRGFTGSRVERLPNYWAAKRNDHALVVSGRYQPIRHFAVFGEGATYTWGLTRTSAELLGFDEEPIRKNGYYGGVEASFPLRGTSRVGVTVTREELSRDDSLIKYLEANGTPGVTMGKTDRGTVARLFFETRHVTVALYWNADETPYPFASGMVPIDSPPDVIEDASNKWGLVVRARLD